MDHLLDDEELPRRERELTLSTGSILGIFFGLVVLCGVFFGFGYNMGRKSAPTPLSLSDVAPEPTVPSSGMSASSKPSAGSPLETTPSVVAPPPKPVRRTPPPTTSSAEASTASEEIVPKATTPKTTAVTTPAPIVRQPAPVSPSALSPTLPPSTAGPGSYMVQVAAVSHQEDATLLVGALRARGYAVSAHSNSADNFIHVQVGPFRDKKEADAMRQRLLTDGYNAIVKQ